MTMRVDLELEGLMRQILQAGAMELESVGGTGDKLTAAVGERTIYQVGGRNDGQIGMVVIT